MATVTTVLVPYPSEVLHGGGVALACGLDGQLRAEERHGLFAADTRVLSTYQLTTHGRTWQLIGRSRTGHATASWQFQNPAIRDAWGDLPAGMLLLSLRRRLAGALHDDLHVSSFAQRQVQVQLALQLDADFADIFEVRAQSLPPRLGISRTASGDALVLRYERGGFRRGLQVRLKTPGLSPIFAGSLVAFDLELPPGAEWGCCLELAPEVDGDVVSFVGDPHGPEPSLAPDPSTPQLRADPLLQAPFERGQADLRSLAIPQPDGPAYLGAGVPWFYTLFGRDQLVAVLMAGLDGAWSAEGALASLKPLQATFRDDWRDAEPGKLPHELRRGELAYLGLIPHTPYYGTHDAPALYCLTLWHAWRWTGDPGLLETYLPTARAALRWCDELGDRDGDGLQEYATRSSRGYYNQGWKDSGEAIVGEDGVVARLPLATVELQGYLYAAKLAMAELLEACGEVVSAERLREEAGQLRALVEERFWLADRGFYALALDGRKRVVASVSSNPGHLLWCGLPSPERARLVARRLLEPDLFSGWGLRTLSANHRAYNPLSYQRGSVWPHDTVLAAAGMWRYALREEGSRLLRAILEAAGAFEEARLPELFCGLDRSNGLPVPYVEANIPQAWAAAAPILAAQLFLGLVPDAPRGRCYLSPWLPEWLPRLEVHGVAVGRGRLDVAVVNRGGGKGTAIESVRAEGVAVVEAAARAPI